MDTWRDSRGLWVVLVFVTGTGCFSQTTPPLSTQMEVPDATVALTQFLEQRDVRFVPGGLELRYSAMRTLDSLATAIVALPRLRLHIDGYAYSQRDSRLNQELSEHRAEAVRLYLALRGVPVAQMETRGHGSTLSGSNPVLGSHSEVSRHIMFRVDEGEW